MKRLLLTVFTLLALPAVAELSVEWHFSDFTGKPARVRRVVIQPLASYGTWGSNIVSGERHVFVTGSSGSLVLSNIHPGAYQVRLIGGTAVTTFTNYFPAEVTGLVNAADYVVVSTNREGEEYAYSAVVSDARYLTNAPPFYASGYVLTLTDTNGGYAWLPSAGSIAGIQNYQEAVTLGGTFTGRFIGRFAGDGGKLTNALSLFFSTNYTRVVCTNYSQFILSGFGDPDANGVYAWGGLMDGNVYFSNGHYLLVSNLLAPRRWGVTNNGLVYYTSLRTNASGYPIGGPWTVAGGTAPGGRMDFVQTFTNGNSFPLVSSTLPVLTPDNNTQARVETYGNDLTGRIGFTPVMPFASIDGVTRYLTNNLGNPTNNGVILVGAGQFPPVTIPLLSGQSVVGLGRGVSVINGSLRAQNRNLLENLTIARPVCNPVYGIGCTNLTLIDVDIGTPDLTNVIDALFSERGYLDGMYGLTAVRCHFASSWDLTEGVVTGTFYDCQLDTVGGPLNNGSGLHPYTVQSDNSFYIIRGGEVNVINGPLTAVGGVPANACVWVTAANANVRLFGPRLNHYGTNGVDYAIYNVYGNTNVIGWYWDNGVLMYVNGTNYWTNTPPPGWPPARLFEQY